MVAALLSLGCEIGSLDKAVLAAQGRDRTSVALATTPGIGPRDRLSASLPAAGRFA